MPLLNQLTQAAYHLKTNGDILFALSFIVCTNQYLCHRFRHLAGCCIFKDEFSGTCIPIVWAGRDFGR
jgi:hypothetical protein